MYEYIWKGYREKSFTSMGLQINMIASDCYVNIFLTHELSPV